MQNHEANGSLQLAPPHAGDAQCPVPHAASQPLPPGHPPVDSAASSSLQPPSDPRCVFFRTQEDVVSAASTPPLSRQSSIAKVADLAEVNIKPLREGEGRLLDPNSTVVLASRSSQLALVQASQTSQMLSAHYGSDCPLLKCAQDTAVPEDRTNVPQPLNEQERAALSHRLDRFGITEPMSFPITSMSTAGDLNAKSPLYVIGGEGRAIWTKELEVALAAGAVDAVVHSLKDVPTTLPENFTLGAILEREDPRDALVVKRGLPYKTLDELPTGSVIGTSSVRRVAQLRARYPGLVFSDVRGNINTRLAKLDAPTGPYTALVLAAAGLIRIGVSHRITAYLSRPVLMYSVGQGCLGIEVRKPPPDADPTTNRDARILELVSTIGDWRSTARAEAERALLKELEGGCSVPVGVETRFDDHDEVEGERSERVEEAVTVAGKEGHTITKAAAGESGEQTASAIQPATSRRLVAESGGIPSSMPRVSSPLAPDRALKEPPSALSPAPTRPGGLERLATGSSDTASSISLARQSPPPMNNATDSSSILSLLKPSRAEDRSMPPPSPIRLYLAATVVSLSGSRTSFASSSALISSVGEAAALGRSVARELAEKKGAREILAEVEKHRQIAEQMDERRREERQRKRQEAEKEIEQVMGTTPRQEGGGDDASRQTEEGRERLEELYLAAHHAQAGNSAEICNGTSALGAYPQISSGDEVDRRGRLREDGQPKVWEV